MSEVFHYDGERHPGAISDTIVQGSDFYSGFGSADALTREQLHARLFGRTTHAAPPNHDAIMQYVHEHPGVQYEEAEEFLGSGRGDRAIRVNPTRLAEPHKIHTRTPFPKMDDDEAFGTPPPQRDFSRRTWLEEPEDDTESHRTWLEGDDESVGDGQARPDPHKATKLHRRVMQILENDPDGGLHYEDVERHLRFGTPLRRRR